MRRAIREAGQGVNRPRPKSELFSGPNRPANDWLVGAGTYKSLGHLQPRCDLAIPSLDLIIEAKFIRQGKSFSKVIGEIAEDVTLYLRSDTPWRRLIPIVWDDSSLVLPG